MNMDPNPLDFDLLVASRERYERSRPGELVHIDIERRRPSLSRPGASCVTP
jgi:hypothetical protein